MDSVIDQVTVVPYRGEISLLTNQLTQQMVKPNFGSKQEDDSLSPLEVDFTMNTFPQTSSVELMQQGLQLTLKQLTLFSKV